MSAKPQLLFLSHCLPYPPQTGVTIRTFNILRQLVRGFDITLVMFSRVNHQPDAIARASARQALQDAGIRAMPAVPVPSEHSVVRRVWDHLRSIAARRAYTYYEYDSPNFKSRLRDVLAQCRPDLIHMDSIDLHAWLSELPEVPITCTHHDLESQGLQQRSEHVGSRVLGRYIRLQAEFVERAERLWCPSFAANLMMSDLDATRLETLVPGARTLVVPNGVDCAYFTPVSASPTAGRVVFVGGTYFFPNRDAVEYLMSDIWSRVRAARGSASLRLIGRSSEADQARYDAVPGVVSLGQVPDVRPHIAEACCCVVPIRFGGGTRIKVLDAWAMGKAVISTSRGCEGLEAVDGENILIRDTPQEIADAVVRVLDDGELRLRLGKGGRATVDERYSWDIIGERLREAYSDLLPN